jgi:hypothetical protein
LDDGDTWLDGCELFFVEVNEYYYCCCNQIKLLYKYVEEQTRQAVVATLAACLDAHEKLKFFYSLSITSIFGPMHEVVNVGKNNN